MRPSMTALALCGLALLLAGCPAEPPLTPFEGPHATASMETTLSDGANMTVFYPTDLPEGETAPVVVLSTGWNQVRSALYSYAIQLAQWGHVSVVRYYPSLGSVGYGGDPFVVEAVAQVSEALDWCAEQHVTAGSPLEGIVDTRTAGAGGHSMGALVAYIASLADDRIQAVATLDGNYADAALEALIQSYAPRTVPLLLLEAGRGGDCSRNFLATYDVYEHALPPAQKVNVINAGHMDFVDFDGTIFSALGRFYVCPGGSDQPDEVQALAARYMVSWFNLHLQGQEAFREYVDGADSAEDVAAGRVWITRK